MKEKQNSTKKRQILNSNFKSARGAYLEEYGNKKFPMNFRDPFWTSSEAFLLAYMLTNMLNFLQADEEKIFR